MRWRIYYGDGSTYSDQDGSPYDAPPDDVQVIVCAEPAVGRMLIAQRDCYWYEAKLDFWFGGDHRGEWDYLRQPGPRKVIFGRFIPNEQYQGCIKRALSDIDFPHKSARHPEEVF